MLRAQETRPENAFDLPHTDVVLGRFTSKSAPVQQSLLTEPVRVVRPWALIAVAAVEGSCSALCSKLHAHYQVS